MQSIEEIQALNEQLADQINKEALANPQSEYVDKFVGILNGKVVIVADTLGEVARFLRQSEIDPPRAIIVEASRDYSVVEEFWSPFDDSD